MRRHRKRRTPPTRLAREAEGYTPVAEIAGPARAPELTDDEIRSREFKLILFTLIIPVGLGLLLSILVDLL